MTDLGAKEIILKLRLGYKPGTSPNEPFDDIEIEILKERIFNGNGWGENLHLFSAINIVGHKKILMMTVNNKRYLLRFLKDDLTIEEDQSNIEADFYLNNVEIPLNLDNPEHGTSYPSRLFFNNETIGYQHSNQM